MTADIIRLDSYREALMLATPRRPGPLYWHDRGSVFMHGAPPVHVSEMDARKALDMYLDHMLDAERAGREQVFDDLHEQLLELVYARRAARAWREANA